MTVFYPQEKFNFEDLIFVNTITQTLILEDEVIKHVIFQTTQLPLQIKG